MKNYITIQLRGGSEYIQDVELMKDEALLLDCSGNSPFINHVWDFICARVWWREGIKIQGNYDLISKTINGVKSPLH